jgi:hypothetical protein
MTASQRHYFAISAFDIRLLEPQLNKQSLTSLLHDVAFDAYFVFFTSFTIMMTQACWAGSERRTLLFRVSSAKSHCTLERSSMQLYCLLNICAYR